VRKLSLAALLFLNTILAFAQYTPATVPNNKLVNNSYVSNPDGIINEATVNEIDTVLACIEKQTTAQVAVVVLRSIGDADIFEFAQELFNLWGVGKSNNNGLLILLVEDQHTVRFHTGLQLEGLLPDALCKQIQRDKMVPSFKEGNYDAGVLGGIYEVQKILTDPNYSAEIVATEDDDIVQGYTAVAIFFLIFLSPIFFIAWAVKKGSFADSKPASHTDYPQMRLKRSTWLIEFGVIPLLIITLYWFGDPELAGGLAFITLYLYFMATVFHRVIRERIMFNQLREQRKYYEITEYLRISQWYWLLIALIFPVPFLVYFPLHFVRKKYYRNHPRKCKVCEGSMNKLSETDDDAFLSKSQLVEENIESVNYDVWKCTSCGTTEAWQFLNRFTSYRACPACKSLAWYVASTKTLKAATYSSSGKGESLYQCKACGKSERKAYSIAQLTRSSSSSSSSSGGSSYSGGSSSSSSGSWGGGSSGGGGASSSW